MSRSPDRRSSLESEAAPRRNHGHAVTNPRMRACSTGVFGSCLRPCAPMSRSPPAAAETNIRVRTLESEHKSRLRKKSVLGSDWSDHDAKLPIVVEISAGFGQL